MGISVCNSSQNVDKKNSLNKKREEQLKKDLQHFKKIKKKLSSTT
tara:strand:- start:3 stop:137 length:135 start_codon:yes stop_codon:yes gene_type:complete